MPPCIACAVFCEDESGHDKTWQEEWANDSCPKCGRGFDVGDRLVVDDDNIVYHYGCFEGPNPTLEQNGASR